jgi:hypothetical protein
LARFASNTAGPAAVTEPGLSAVRLSSFFILTDGAFHSGDFDLVASN